MAKVKDPIKVEAGRKGGQAKVPKGFAITGNASEMGKIGGKKKKKHAKKTKTM